MHDESTTATSNQIQNSKGRRLGELQAAWVYIRSIVLDLVHRLLRRRKRHKEQVAADYDQGQWAQQARSRDWEKVESLAEYVDRTWVTAERTCMIDGELWKLSSVDYYRFRRHQVSSILERFAGEYDTLVEAGSGTGLNLFSLAIEGEWSSLIGLELSATGREVAQEVARRFGVDGRVSFGELDLLDASSPGFERMQDKPVFTYLCLEQLPNDTERVFRNLLRARPARVIHIEPSFELLRSFSLRDLASMSYVLRQDYQRTLVRVAKKLEREGLIEILAAERLHYSPSWRNAPTLLAWAPRNA